MMAERKYDLALVNTAPGTRIREKPWYEFCRKILLFMSKRKAPRTVYIFSMASSIEHLAYMQALLMLSVYLIPRSFNIQGFLAPIL